MKSLFFTDPDGRSVEERAIANMREGKPDPQVHEKPQSEHSRRKKIARPHHDWLMPTAGTS